MIKKKRLALITATLLLSVSLLAGCTTIPSESSTLSAPAASFSESVSVSSEEVLPVQINESEQAVSEDVSEAHVHEWIEANFQQPKTCATCGETDGEPLTAQFDGIPFATADAENDLTLNCEEEKIHTTTAKVKFYDYRIFDSDESHPAVDGYEYRSVLVRVATGDENLNKYGYAGYSLSFDDYYSRLPDNEYEFTVNWNGTNYYGCTMVYERVDETLGKKNSEYKKAFGWNQLTCTLIGYYTFLIPVGYDGMVVAAVDHVGIPDDIALKDIPLKVCFRLN